MSMDEYKVDTDAIHDDVDNVIESLSDKMKGAVTEEDKMVIEALSNFAYQMQFSFMKTRNALIKTHEQLAKIRKSEE